MKPLVWIIAAINIYFGMRAFLNVIHVMNTSKYSATATAVFAVLFLAMGIGSIYLALAKNNYSAAFWLGIGPWILSLVFLLFNMLTSDYK